MHKGDDENFVPGFQDLIEHAIAVENEQLTDCRVPLFRHDATAFRKLPK